LPRVSHNSYTRSAYAVCTRSNLLGLDRNLHERCSRLGAVVVYRSVDRDVVVRVVHLDVPINLLDVQPRD
jgi:hypothetical protein